MEINCNGWKTPIEIKGKKIEPGGYSIISDIDWEEAHNTNDLDKKIKNIIQINNATLEMHSPQIVNKNQNVSSKYPLIFVHITKTAGKSVYEALNIKDKDRGHGRLLDLKKLIDPDIYSKYKKITIVRNPFDKLVSVYFYYKENGFITNLDRDFTFEEWFWNLDIHISNILPIKFEGSLTPWFNSMCYPSYDILLNENKNVEIDYILYFENLDEDWKWMFNELDIKPPKLPKPKKSENRKHYSHYYHCDTGDIIKEYVYKIFANDFKNFNYDFDDQYLQDGYLRDINYYKSKIKNK